MRLEQQVPFEVLVTVGAMVAILIALQWAFRTMTTPNPANTEPVRLVKSYCGDVMRHIGEAGFDRGSIEQRQILSAYIFGGVCSLIPFWGLNRTQVSTIVMAVYEDCCGYSDDESASDLRAAFAAAEDPTSHLNDLIVRGGKGFLAWQKNRDAFVAADIRDVIGRTKVGSQSKVVSAEPNTSLERTREE